MRDRLEVSSFKDFSCREQKPTLFNWYGDYLVQESEMSLQLYCKIISIRLFIMINHRNIFQIKNGTKIFFWILLSLLLDSSCSLGYSEQKHYGIAHLPDSGQISGGIDTDLRGCAKRCTDDPTCGSFEYSQELKKCDLNRDSRPSVEKHLDYIFCQKETGMDYIDCTALKLICNDSVSKVSISDNFGGEHMKWNWENFTLKNAFNGGFLGTDEDLGVKSYIPGQWFLDYNGRDFH